MSPVRIRLIRRFTDAWARLRPLVHARPRQLVLLAVRAVIAGFLEAGVLVVLVQIAFTISSGDDKIEVVLGPLGSVTFTLTSLFLIALGLGILRLVVQVADSRLASRISAEALVTLRREVTTAYEASSWPRQAEEREGSFQEVVGGHTARVAGAVLVLAGALSAGFNLLALLASAIIVDAIAAMTIVVGVSALFFILRPLARRSRASSKAIGELSIDLGQSVNDLVRLSQEIKVHHLGEERARAVGATIDAGGAAYFRNQVLGRSVPAIYQAAAMVLIISTLAGINAADITSVRSLGAIVLMLVRALSYGQTLQSAYQSIGDLLPYADRVTEAIDSYQDATPVAGTTRIERIEGIRFDAVSFTYPDQRDALEDVSFTLGPGECLGVVGPSGAGKSTLTQILLGLRQPTSGAVTVNGIAQTDLDPAAWFARIGFVPQDPQLIEGTVADNIAFFRDGPTRDEIVAAATLAQLHTEIEALPEGYDTPIGPRHQTVSGGQRQRLCLARAVLERPDLLILDEPTSALDLRSEHLVHQTLGEMAEDLMVVVIAHRLSTLNICDRIMVLEDGSVRGLLPAAELEQQNDFFREVVALANLR
jgi:ABC-type multidrug transport system fused ATPase/permease subunit